MLLFGLRSPQSSFDYKNEADLESLSAQYYEHIAKSVGIARVRD